MKHSQAMLRTARLPALTTTADMTGRCGAGDATRSSSLPSTTPFGSFMSCPSTNDRYIKVFHNKKAAHIGEGLEPLLLYSDAVALSTSVQGKRRRSQPSPAPSFWRSLTWFSLDSCNARIALLPRGPAGRSRQPGRDTREFRQPDGHSVTALGSWLCVPAFQRVCRYRSPLNVFTNVMPCPPYAARCAQYLFGEGEFQVLSSFAM